MRVLYLINLINLISDKNLNFYQTLKVLLPSNMEAKYF